MLGVKTYTKTYIASCRALLAETLATYNGSGAFEQPFLRNMVIALDHYFMHRLRGVEGKDGNPLNEVRMLCNSILENSAVLTEDSSIKYKPEASVLKIAIGERIVLDRAGFERLAEAYFADIERKFS